MTAIANTMPTCLYIAGSGRNGSTLLGLHLGRRTDVCFAGELTHIWRRGYLNDELCGCGEPFSRCEFWREVTRTAFGTWSERDTRHLLRLRDQVSDLRRIALPLATSPSRSSAEEAEYAAAYRALLAAIATVSAARVVVDSSKYPTDLAALLRTKAVPLRVVHLVRDCNAVVFSWKRKRLRPEIHWKTQLMPRYSALKTALGWRLFNAAIEQLARDPAHDLDGRYLRLRYEDLVASFPETLAEICDWMGCPSAAAGASDCMVHTVSGNPCRFELAPRQIELDDEWRARMSFFDRTLVALVCGGAQRFYGYGGKNRNNIKEPGLERVGRLLHSATTSFTPVER